MRIAQFPLQHILSGNIRPFWAQQGPWQHESILFHEANILHPTNRYGSGVAASGIHYFARDFNMSASAIITAGVVVLVRLGIIASLSLLSGSAYMLGSIPFQ